MSRDMVIWHDLECGMYAEDHELWRTLAQEAGGPVLDVGAGTGRVTIDLARRGYEVVALDLEPALLGALAHRAEVRGLGVETVAADARSFDLGRRFALVIAPMQTVQLLGPEGRVAFLTRALEHTAPGGRLAIALADALESFDGDSDLLPGPDVGDVDGWHYSSLPLAVVDEGGRAAIHRLREITGPNGERRESSDVIRLDRIDPPTLEAEAVAVGWTVEPSRHIPATEEYVGSTVVVLRA